MYHRAGGDASRNASRAICENGLALAARTICIDAVQYYPALPRSGSCRHLFQLHLQHILSFDVSHQLRHSLRMHAVYVAVSAKNQRAAVFVPLPLRNHFHVYAFLYRSRYEHPAE